MKRYHGDLILADDFVEEVAPAEQRPFRDLIFPAWYSAPDVIANRGQLLKVVATTYEELGGGYGSDLKALSGAWEGRAWEAYADYGDNVSKYLQKLQASADWLGGQTVDVANLIKDVRTSFANLGHRYITQVSAAIQTYRDTLLSQVGRLVGCTNPVGAADGALGLIRDLASGLEREKQAVHERAMTLLSGGDKRSHDEFKDASHDEAPFPSYQLDVGAWDRDAGWKPKPEPAE